MKLDEEIQKEVTHYLRSKFEIYERLNLISDEIERLENQKKLIKCNDKAVNLINARIERKKDEHEKILNDAEEAESILKTVLASDELCYIKQQYIFHRTWEMICEKYGISSKTLQKKLREAKKKLYIYLNNHGIL